MNKYPFRTTERKIVTDVDSFIKVSEDRDGLGLVEITRYYKGVEDFSFVLNKDAATDLMMCIFQTIGDINE